MSDPDNKSLILDDDKKSIERVFLLTSLLLLLHGDTTGMLEIPFRVVCSAAIVFPAVRSSACFWCTVSAYMFFVNAGDWYIIDNHKYLITIWAASLAFATIAPDAIGAARANARILIGFCFTFATAWKIIGQEYTSGDFVASTMILDGRVGPIADWVGGFADGELTFFRDVISLAKAAPREDIWIGFEPSAGLLLWAKVLSYATVIGEELIAISWLCFPRQWHYIRDALLIGFVSVVYFFLPVVGFASILALLGYTSTLLSGRTRAAVVYLAVLAFVQFYSFPWVLWLWGE